MKKKLLLLLLLVGAILFVSGCGKTEEKKSEEVKKVGGWEVDTSAKKLNIPKEAQKAFERATENYDGLELEPVALLGTQVVSGTNYMFLCKGTTVTEKPSTDYKIVVVYNNLKDKSSIKGVEDFDLNMYIFKDNEVDKKDVSGGWSVYNKTEAQELDKKVKKAYDAALEKMSGVEYTPIALLGSQLVSGNNYAVLALGKTTTKEPTYTIAVLTIYNDLNDKANVESVSEIDLSNLNK